MLSTTLNKGIFDEFICTWSVGGILIQTLLNEVLADRAHAFPSMLLEFNRTITYSFSSFLVFFFKERSNTLNDEVCQDTESPDVNLGISNFSIDDFGREKLKFSQIGLNIGVCETRSIIEALYGELKVILIIALENDIGWV